MSGGDPIPIVPAAGAYRPGVVTVRLVCSPDVLDATLAHLADLHGDGWQPSTRKPSRHGDGQVIQYGTLIVPVPRAGSGGTT